ncbi:MAG: hypothetical protein GKR89_14275 [Candidatus Latescibacteria bacterium]|nr:hypothetical protein [Candidatus Latescibacterota bacterium]
MKDMTQAGWLRGEPGENRRGDFDCSNCPVNEKTDLASQAGFTRLNWLKINSSQQNLVTVENAATGAWMACLGHCGN